MTILRAIIHATATAVYCTLTRTRKNISYNRE